MKFKSPVYSQASGSIAGLTYSHNRGGMYSRARSIPTNPSSSFQNAVRANLQTLVARWGQTLTQAQRDLWTAYAAVVLRTDSLGEPRQLTGLNWYVAVNTLRIQSGGNGFIVNDAPAVLSEGVLTSPTIVSATAATSVISVGFTNTDLWASAASGRLMLYSSPPQSPGVSYYKGPYRFAGNIVGATTPPTSPQPYTSPFAFAVGQRLFMQFRSINPSTDRRISPPFRVSALGV